MPTKGKTLSTEWIGEMYWVNIDGIGRRRMTWRPRERIVLAALDVCGGQSRSGVSAAQLVRTLKSLKNGIYRASDKNVPPTWLPWLRAGKVYAKVNDQVAWHQEHLKPDETIEMFLYGGKMHWGDMNIQWLPHTVLHILKCLARDKVLLQYKVTDAKGNQIELREATVSSRWHLLLG